MSGTVLKIARIGNSRGIRLPAALLRKYHITDFLIAEEKPHEIVLRPLNRKGSKLTWEATAQAMAAADEDWSDWTAADADGLQGL